MKTVLKILNGCLEESGIYIEYNKTNSNKVCKSDIKLQFHTQRGPLVILHEQPHVCKIW